MSSTGKYAHIPASVDNRGLILESFVFLNIRPYVTPNMEIRFWRTKKGDEVDFVIVKDRQPIPIEVKAGRVDRVPAGIRAFCRKYKPDRTYTVCSEPPPDTIVDGTSHHFVDLCDVGTVMPQISQV